LIWWETEFGYYTSYEFSDISIPTGATITSVMIYVEHYEEEDFRNGKLQWNVGTGWPNNPVVWDSIVPPVHQRERNESIDSWGVTNVVNTPENVNSLELRVKNNDNVEEKKTLVDYIYVDVSWTTGLPSNQAITANAVLDQTVDFAST